MQPRGNVSPGRKQYPVRHDIAQATAVLPFHASLRYGHALALVRTKAKPDAIREFEITLQLSRRTRAIERDWPSLVIEWANGRGVHTVG